MFQEQLTFFFNFRETICTVYDYELEIGGRTLVGINTRIISALVVDVCPQTSHTRRSN